MILGDISFFAVLFFKEKHANLQEFVSNHCITIRNLQQPWALKMGSFNLKKTNLGILKNTIKINTPESLNN